MNISYAALNEGKLFTFAIFEDSSLLRKHKTDCATLLFSLKSKLVAVCTLQSCDPRKSTSLTANDTHSKCEAGGFWIVSSNNNIHKNNHTNETARLVPFFLSKEQNLSEILESEVNQLKDCISFPY